MRQLIALVILGFLAQSALGGERSVEVIPHLWLTNYLFTQNREMLSQINPHLGISVAEECVPSEEMVDISEETIHLMLEDEPSQTLIPAFSTIYDKVHAALIEGKNVLVHCQEGVSRSASFVLYYLMRSGEVSSLQGGLDLIRSRFKIAPNYGFMQELLSFEKRLFGSESLKLREYSLDLLQYILPERSRTILEAALAKEPNPLYVFMALGGSYRDARAKLCSQGGW